MSRIQQLTGSLEHGPRSARPLSYIFNRYYWIQIALIAFSVVIGIVCSALVIKGSLLTTALQQEMAHYWLRVQKNPQADLPDTKNLYGYRWYSDNPPARFASLHLQPGVHRVFVDGKARMTVYGEQYGQHVLLVFGESNVNRLVWMFGLAPLMLSLFVLYSALWWFNRRAHQKFSPLTQLATTLQHIDWERQQSLQSPFDGVSTEGNMEAERLKQALEQYHQTLMAFIKREQQFTGDVSHELRTPLTVLKGNVQLCQSRYGQDKALSRLLNTIEDMQLLVDTLLALARNHTARLPKEPASLVGVLEQLVQELQPLAQSRHMHINIHVQHDVVLSLNPAMTSMIFSNVLRNALNYSQGQQIDIVIDAHKVMIADDGVGMPLNRNSPVEPKGHGIGLQLVSRLCERLQWRVELYDRQQYAQPIVDDPANAGVQKSGLVVVIYLG